VIQRFGQPFGEGTVIKNGVTLKTVSYAYSSAGGKPFHEGVTPVRALTLFFQNDRLVGHEFVSSWAEDNTDFDGEKVKDIVKGKSTRAEVVRLLGKPSGYCIVPMVKAPSQEAAVYVYTETRHSAFKLKIFRKQLVVSFDAAGVVYDVEFISSGSK
jgi:hypothetical protein